MKPLPADRTAQNAFSGPLPLLVFTVLVAMFRVVLGLHYPTDVLAGVLIGTALGGVSVWSCSVFFLALA